MKLNPDCVRAILQAVEESTDFHTAFEYIPGAESHCKIQKYTHKEIIYHIHQCQMSGLVHNCTITGNGGYVTIEDLSPKGHEFLAKVESDTIWSKTKEIAGAIGTVSLDATIQIASAVLTEIVKARLKIT